MTFRKYFFVSLICAVLSVSLCLPEGQAAPSRKAQHSVQVRQKTAASHIRAKKAGIKAEKKQAASKTGRLALAKKGAKAASAGKRHGTKMTAAKAAGMEKKGYSKTKFRARKRGHVQAYRYPRHSTRRYAASSYRGKKDYNYTGLLPSVKRPPTVYRANLCPTVVSLGMDLTDIASTQIGLPYRSGGTSPRTGFDCSGFVQWVYAKQGVKVPRSTHELKAVGREVSKSSLLPGDILIFRSPRASSGLHTGIYVGNNKFIHSPHTGSSIHLEDMDNSFYKRNYLTARRILKAPPCETGSSSDLDFLYNRSSF